jgi:Xaa-Pro aminopeptidase
MIREKIAQAVEILKEEKIDCWLTFVRESSTTPDSIMDLTVGTGVTWHSAFIITAAGDTFAIVGSLDKANQETHGHYRHILGYVQSIEQDLRNTLEQINAQSIAINYSLNSPASDGLTHGMYLQLLQYLQDTPYAAMLTSSERIINKLRGRKSAGEIERIRKAIGLTIQLFEEAGKFIRVGRTEKEIGDFLTRRTHESSLQLAWEAEHCPAVFSGPDTAGAHAGPTTRLVQAGHVLNIDFGVKADGYCSDLQRTWYIMQRDEKDAPKEVRKGFQTIVESISRAATALKPGVSGFEIDRVARKYIVKQGYAEYPHALGHQIGRFAHDGGGLLAPQWERYGSLPDLPVEKNQVYTLEPRLTIPGYGIATVEEIVVVTEKGCEFLSPRQEKLFLIKQ